MKALDYLIIIILLAWVLAALIYLICLRKKGKHLDCNGCVYHDKCNKDNCKKKKK